MSATSPPPAANVRAAARRRHPGSTMRRRRLPFSPLPCADPGHLALLFPFAGCLSPRSRPRLRTAFPPISIPHLSRFRQLPDRAGQRPLFVHWRVTAPCGRGHGALTLVRCTLAG